MVQFSEQYNTTVNILKKNSKNSWFWKINLKKDTCLFDLFPKSLSNVGLLEIGQSKSQFCFTNYLAVFHFVVLTTVNQRSFSDTGNTRPNIRLKTSVRQLRAAVPMETVLVIDSNSLYGTIYQDWGKYLWRHASRECVKWHAHEWLKKWDLYLQNNEFSATFVNCCYFWLWQLIVIFDKLNRPNLNSCVLPYSDYDKFIGLIYDRSKVSSCRLRQKSNFTI